MWSITGFVAMKTILVHGRIESNINLHPLALKLQKIQLANEFASCAVQVTLLVTDYFANSNIPADRLTASAKRASCAWARVASGSSIASVTPGMTTAA